MAKIFPCLGTHSEIGILPKVAKQGILYAHDISQLQVVNVLIIKIKDIEVVAVKFSNIFLEKSVRPEGPFHVKT